MGFRKVIALLALLGLTACGAAEPIWAPQTEVDRAVYVHGGQPTLTLFTVVSNGSGSGAHSGLMVNAPSQRVLFDPAGTFQHPHLPERNDVHYGMTDKAVDFYIDYHARETYHVVKQTVPVSSQVAQLALSRVQSYGAVPKAQCAQSISDILSGLPGFTDVPRSMFPKKLMKYFEARPDVTRDVTYDDSPDENGTIRAPDLRLPVVLAAG
ncbi:hypothetical protein [Celeribacter sp.]|uniref:hypothetical protein n=1 Tax=Celeribacter sp. TaxID=1890673 RepID=UPI003A927D2A